MCKYDHSICEGETSCIYEIDGVDCSDEALIARLDVPVPFTLSNLGQMALTVCEAVPTLPIKEAAKIATYLDSLGYCKAPF